MKRLVVFVFLSAIRFQAIGMDSLATIKLPSKVDRKLNSESKLSVYLFFSADCPLCRIYISYLNELYKNYQDTGVNFTYIFSSSLSTREVQDFVDRFGVKGKVVRDNAKKYMQAFQATTTPEVFVLDNSAKLVYSGAIDNRAYEIGKLRKVITEEYLNSVIQSKIDNRVVLFERIPPIGCLLEE